LPDKGDVEAAGMDGVMSQQAAEGRLQQKQQNNDQEVLCCFDLAGSERRIGNISCLPVMKSPKSPAHKLPIIMSYVNFGVKIALLIEFGGILI
jgi:hypothetical protein